MESMKMRSMTCAYPLLLLSLLTLSVACGDAGWVDEAGTNQEELVADAPLPAPAPPAFIDAQTWWTPDSAAGVQGHIHMGTEVPQGPVSGIVTLRFRMQTFMLPGKTSLVRMNIGGLAVRRRGERASPGTEDWLETLSIDTTELSTDGWTTLTYETAYVEQDRKTVHLVVVHPLYVQNGRPVAPGPRPVSRATSWVGGGGDGKPAPYMSTHVRGGPFPITAPSVEARFNVSQFGAANFAFATVNPRMHEGDEGVVVLPRQPVSQRYQPLRLEAGRHEPAPHKLFLQTSNEAGRVRQVLVVPFVIGR
jgi:hypothetical protein